MLRLLAAALAATLMLVLPAVAGDNAALTILGYSEDGHYFAFEESGEFDGAGGYYDHIYVVKIDDDTWVKGTPFSMETSDDGVANPVPFMQVHQKVVDEAAPLLKQLKIGIPALFLNGTFDAVPDVPGDGKVLTVDQTACCGPTNIDTSLEYKLTLKTFPAKIEDGICNVDGALGFSLTEEYTTADVTPKSQVVHQDGDTLPRSRSCPQDYRIYAVVHPAIENDGGPIAIISVYPYDFEGLSRRFIIVPLN